MDKYEKLSVVGRGTEGICYLCRRLDGTKVVVKQIYVDDGMDAQQKLYEVEVMQTISHPNVIGFKEYFFDEETLCIVMEHAQGGTLLNMLEQRQGDPLDEGRILFYFAQIALSVQYLHSQGILHRDLKPANILLNRSRTVCKVTDFGQSKLFEKLNQASMSHFGSPAFIAPEIWMGKTYNHKSDIWSLGCILYQMITLKPAFEALSLAALIRKICQGNYSPVGDHISAPLRTLIGSLFNVNDRLRPELSEILTSPLLRPAMQRVLLEVGPKSLPPSVKSVRSPPISIQAPISRSYLRKIVRWAKKALRGTHRYNLTHL